MHLSMISLTARLPKQIKPHTHIHVHAQYDLVFRTALENLTRRCQPLAHRTIIKSRPHTISGSAVTNVTNLTADSPERKDGTKLKLRWNNTNKCFDGAYGVELKNDNGTETVHLNRTKKRQYVFHNIDPCLFYTVTVTAYTPEGDPAATASRQFQRDTQSAFRPMA